MSHISSKAIQERKVDSLVVKEYANRMELGDAAARAVIDTINQLLEHRQTVNIVFAAAPSQNEFLEALILADEVDWSRINAFHMDEYIGLAESAPQGFGNFLKERIFAKVPFHSVHYLDGNNPDPQKECLRYADLLDKYPTDIVCMGIGENSHIAFNDPHVADFNDPEPVKIVDLDLECRQQQVNDGCFAALKEVPSYALTLTIPTLLGAQYIFCMVPGSNKAKAVRHTLEEAVNPVYPSTILRRHPQAVLFIDKDSGALLESHTNL
ncbi:glucosamine-6-phosphate deaminase [Parapedobacter tibetensis]|uniref:glucosamine-6-phosphate deaminase n=1 Tax=Parapedobacter tibetensis TaxID=2972951 RepID=UPI00214D251B|nr:glucosamine-6-phosphate deaminase [Parapedobacter tibetensis]